MLWKTSPRFGWAVTGYLERAHLVPAHCRSWVPQAVTQKRISYSSGKHKDSWLKASRDFLHVGHQGKPTIFRRYVKVHFSWEYWACEPPRWTLGPFSITSFHFGLFFASCRRIGFLLVAISEQTVWEGRGRAGAFVLGLQHQPCPGLGAAVGSRPAEPLQPGQVQGGAAAVVGCCVRGCGGFYDPHFLNISDAREEQGVTHSSESWVSLRDRKVQKARV